MAASAHSHRRLHTGRSLAVAAAICAQAHIAHQVCLLVDAYQRANPRVRGGDGGVAMSTTDPTTEAALAIQPTMFTEQQVGAALNHAADDILDAVDAGDEGLRDGLNLLVNAAVAYLTGRAQNLREVVQQGYDADYEDVLGWIEVAL